MGSYDNERPPQKNLFDEIDPQWAWSQWSPSGDDPWNRQRAAHLHRRAGFGASKADLDNSVAKGFEATIEQFFAAPPENDPLMRESEQLARTIVAARDPKQLASWWLRWMRFAPRPLIEKMTLFWHGHFATSADKVPDCELMYQQNQLLRNHALGDFAKLAHGIAKDPAMLLYLDSAYNRKAHPNENFARELVELFCMGEGNYTEKDVQELARCFTGWEIRRNRFRFNPYQHDDGLKSIFGSNAIRSGEEAIDLVLQQPAVPRFLVAKLFKFFVADEPAPPPELLEPLTKRLIDDRLNVKGVVEQIIMSRLMFDPRIIGRKIRSPIELAIGTLKALEATTNFRFLADSIQLLGQNVFYPPSVKGWDGGRAWINSSTMVGRANLVYALMQNEATRFAGGSLEDWARKQGASDVASFIDVVVSQCMAVAPPNAGLENILRQAKDWRGNAAWTKIIGVLAALPEMQLG